MFPEDDERRPGSASPEPYSPYRHAGELVGKTASEPPEPDPLPEDVVNRLTSLHYALFEMMPDEGSTLGYHPMVVTVSHLREKLNAMLPEGAPKITSGSVQAELRNLRKFGLATVVKTLSGSTVGWQRTEKGKEALRSQSPNTPAA